MPSNNQKSMQDSENLIDQDYINQFNMIIDYDDKGLLSYKSKVMIALRLAQVMYFLHLKH